MLKFYNTLNKKIEEFVPLKKTEVKMYVCGPTVYSLDHLGHARVGVFYDVVRRYFQFLGYKVIFVQNITDVGHLTEDGEVEDKIIREARRQNKSPIKIARYFEKKHFEVMAKLNVLPPDYSPRASEFISQMIKFIQQMVRKEYAYQTKTGVYLSVSKIKDYGRLSGRLSYEKQIKGARINLKEDKKDPRDFALWIKADPLHLLQWPSPWGQGYPGWHIECSTMIYELLGFPIDIHGGGVDLIFPHHENERAQGIAFFKKEPVNYYLHLGQVMFKGKKMSKSLGNVIILEELLEKYPVDWIRLSLLLTHYRKPLDFTESRIRQASKIINRLRQAKYKRESQEGDRVFKEIQSAINNNFNFSKALALWDKNRHLISQEHFKKLRQIFGLSLQRERISKKVRQLVQEREKARQEKQFKKSDALRAKIEKLGYLIEDTAKGPRIKRR